MPKTRQTRLTAARTDTPATVTFTATANIDLEAKAADGTPKLATFSIKGYTGAVMSVAGFKVPVIVDLGGIKATSETIPALLDHDTTQIVGQTDAVTIGSDGVDLAGVIMGEDAAAERVKTLARNGFKWQASIGANIVRQEFLKAGENAQVNGREVAGPLLIARESRLFEISFVAIGADGQTTAAVAASSTPGPPMKGEPTMFEQWLQAKGFDDPTAISDTQRTFLRAMYDAEQAPPKAGDAGQTQSLDQIVQARRQEDDRVAQITQMSAVAINSRPPLVDDIDKLARSAIEAKSPVKDFELQLLRLQTHCGPGSGPGVHVRKGETRAGRKMIEAALCQSGKLDGIDKHFDDATLTAADERFPHGIGLKDLLIMAARENGVTGLSNSDVRGMLGAAFNPAIRAEFSTLSLPGIMSNVANKFLVAGFSAVESAWREIASIRSVRDFKQTSTYALNGSMIYDKVGPAGELKHATVSEQTYNNQAETYGKMFAVTRTDIINDDLGALTAVPRKLGRGAALKLNLVFWTEFLASLNTFYTSGRGNVSTGAGSALSTAGLTAAEIKFKRQTDPDGMPLAIVPKVLLVPPELEITADQLMTSLIVNTGGSSTTDMVPNRNVWANKYRTVVSTYLSNSSLTGFSTAAWWLIADPADLPLIEVAFLNGREQPIVESADADFNTLGINMRGYFDFGVAKQEYRSAVRSAGS